MKLERRGDGAPEGLPGPETVSEAGPREAPPSPTPAGRGNKPVIVYIMVLFIVAFLLMALSFLMHQRSNAEVIGSLQSSVSTLQEVQAAKDENIRLQEELRNVQRELDELRLQMDDLETSQVQSRMETDALLALYALQQQYAAGDYSACRQLIQSMENAGQGLLLSKDAVGGAISPAERYQQLKEAVSNP